LASSALSHAAGKFVLLGFCPFRALEAPDKTVRRFGAP